MSRILHIYSGNLYGGIENHLSTLIQTDVKRNLEPSQGHFVALCFHGQLFDELTALGRTPFDLGPVRLRYPWTTLRARSRLSAILKKTNFRCLVTHGVWSYRLAQKVATKNHIPCALWVHDYFPGTSANELFAVQNPPDLLIANSNFSSIGMCKAFGREVDAIIYPVTKNQPSANPSHARTQIRAELKTHPDSVVITQLSRFETLKGHKVLLEALALLKDNPGWTAWIVGSTQQPHEIAYLEDLNKLAIQSGIIDRIRFTGQRLDIPEILAASDIHCQPNLSPESFGLTYIESLASGVPCVGSNFGGAAEIITDNCGRLVPPGDHKALAQTLTELIASPNLRSQLASNGPSRASQLCNPYRALTDLEILVQQKFPT